VARQVCPDEPVNEDVCAAGTAAPAMVTRDEAIAIAEALSCRLPSEAEWEACCRAGSSGPFPWGSTLPDSTTLERWLDWSLVDDDLQRSVLGFGGLFFGEWCANEFRVSHQPDAPVRAGAFVVKGGGAQFWPWQNQEWVWCMCAMRMPSADLFADRRCAVRLARDLTTRSE
jgi:hypothetical protein